MSQQGMGLEIFLPSAGAAYVYTSLGMSLVVPWCDYDIQLSRILL